MQRRDSGGTAGKRRGNKDVQDYQDNGGAAGNGEMDRMTAGNDRETTR